MTLYPEEVALLALSAQVPTPAILQLHAEADLKPQNAKNRVKANLLQHRPYAL
jgi:hypothetical protein